MKLGKYYDREKMDWSEKKSISKKSDDLCCHCGKPAFFGKADFVDRVATIEHVIPICRGGSNINLNLVMLCEDCNKTKDRKIMPISWYPYLKEEYKNSLNDYITSYMKVMDTERTHILTYDEYEFPIDQKFMMGYRGHGKPAAFQIKVKLKRASWDDFDIMVDYLVKYLKKNKILDSVEAAQMNIAFWMTFSSIYYIEKNNEITCMTVITMKHVSSVEDYHGIDIIPFMYIFPYYTTDQNVLMVYDMIMRIPEYICKEKDLKIMPASALFVKEDKMISKLRMIMRSIPADISNFEEFQLVISNENETLITSKTYISDENKPMSEDEKKTYEFVKQFKDINDNILSYLYKYSNSDDILWMTNCLISYSLIENTELGNKLKTLNDYILNENN